MEVSVVKFTFNIDIDSDKVNVWRPMNKLKELDISFHNMLPRD